WDEEHCGDGEERERERARQELGHAEEPELGDHRFEDRERGGEDGQLAREGQEPEEDGHRLGEARHAPGDEEVGEERHEDEQPHRRDRKSTRLNSSHQIISYAVFCLKKKKKKSRKRSTGGRPIVIRLISPEGTASPDCR